MLKSSDLPTKINHLKIQQIPNKTQEKAFNKSNPINMYVQKTYTNLINSIPNILWNTSMISPTNQPSASNLLQEWFHVQIWYDKSQVHYRIHLWYLRLQLIFFKDKRNNKIKMSNEFSIPVFINFSRNIWETFQ